MSWRMACGESVQVFNSLVRFCLALPTSGLDQHLNKAPLHPAPQRQRSLEIKVAAGQNFYTIAHDSAILKVFTIVLIL